MILADDADSYDTYDIAQVLSSAIKRSGADVVLFGEGSSDRYFRQVGAVTGTLLGWPTANCVSGISIESDVAKVERTLDSVVTQLEAPLPVALTLTADINVPRMPGMRDIIQSGKKPFTILSPGDLGVCKAEATETIEELAPSEPERKQLVIEGTPEEMVSQLIGHLKRDAAL